MGNDESRDFVRAADGQARKIQAANDSFTTNPAFSPTISISGQVKGIATHKGINPDRYFDIKKTLILS